MSALLIAYGIIGLITWHAVVAEMQRGGRRWRARNWRGELATLVIVLTLWPWCYARWFATDRRKEKAHG